MEIRRHNLHAAWLVTVLIIVGGPASAQKVANEYDRGCMETSADSCSPADKEKARKSVARARSTVEWNRGCLEAQRGAYDSNKHSLDYETGWQICKPLFKARK